MNTLEEMRRKHRESNSFDVICSQPSHRANLRLVVSQLSWDKANAVAEALQARYSLRHPNKTAWVSRLYWARLHQPHMLNKCPVCEKPVKGKAVFCSPRCRKVSSRSQLRIGNCDSAPT